MTTGNLLRNECTENFKKFLVLSQIRGPKISLIGKKLKKYGGKTILPQKWSYDVIGLSQAPETRTSCRYFLCSFIWAQKQYGSGFGPQLVIFIHQLRRILNDFI